MTIVRSHTWANVAPAAKTLLAQINAAYPTRKMTNEGKDSDGIWPSPAHTKANPNSDHEGGNALDIDDDLSGREGVLPELTAEMVRRMSMHPANKYGIHDSGIYYDGVRYPYRGSNPHTGHAHISIIESRRNDTSPWDIGEKEEDDGVQIDCLWVIVTGSGDNLNTVKTIAEDMGLWAGVVTTGEMWVHVRQRDADALLTRLAGYKAFRDKKVRTIPTHAGSFRQIVWRG